MHAGPDSRECPIQYVWCVCLVFLLIRLWVCQCVHGLLISGLLKHTTTVLDDRTTATTAHGLQFHPTNTQIIFNTKSKRGRGNTVAVQGMNIEILPPEGKNDILWSTHHLPQAPYKSSLNTSPNARGQHSSHRQELTSPEYPHVHNGVDTKDDDEQDDDDTLLIFSQFIDR